VPCPNTTVSGLKAAIWIIPQNTSQGTIWARVGDKYRLRVVLPMAGYYFEKGKEPFCQAGKKAKP